MVIYIFGILKMSILSSKHYFWVNSTGSWRTRSIFQTVQIGPSFGQVWVFCGFAWPNELQIVWNHLEMLEYFLSFLTRYKTQSFTKNCPGRCGLFSATETDWREQLDTRLKITYSKGFACFICCLAHVPSLLTGPWWAAKGSLLEKSNQWKRRAAKNVSWIPLVSRKVLYHFSADQWDSSMANQLELA